MTLCEERPPLWVEVLLGVIVGAVLLLCVACAPVPKVPPQSAPAVEVKVPVPVPCEITQVPAPTYPKVMPGSGLFDLVKTMLAERELRIADQVRLRAANTTPCPGGAVAK